MPLLRLPLLLLLPMRRRSSFDAACLNLSRFAGRLDLLERYDGVKLIVGLGNPGIEYQFTPHNAGFLAVDRIAEDCGVMLSNRRGRALTARAKLAGQEVLLAKPETFMNLSGLSVAALIQEFEISPKDIIVLYDELALPLGTIRIRERGSANGHNGR